MTLAQYLKKPGDVRRFAERIGVTHQTVYRWRNGKARPTHKDLMAKIVAATGGRVRPGDFYGRPSRPEAGL